VTRPPSTAHNGWMEVIQDRDTVALVSFKCSQPAVQKIYETSNSTFQYR